MYTDTQVDCIQCRSQNDFETTDQDVDAYQLKSEPYSCYELARQFGNAWVEKTACNKTCFTLNMCDHLASPVKKMTFFPLHQCASKHRTASQHNLLLKVETPTSSGPWMQHGFSKIN